MSTKTKSQPKQMMIKFIKETVQNPEFQFRLRGNEDDAKRFVHRMRVELSRMRDVVRESGRVPKEFKVLLHEIDFDPMQGISTITLIKTEGKTIHIAEEINEIFDDLASGEMIR